MNIIPNSALARNMILNTKSDAAYLMFPESQNQSGVPLLKTSSIVTRTILTLTLKIKQIPKKTLLSSSTLSVNNFLLICFTSSGV